MYSTHCVPFIFIIWDICLFEFGVYAFVLWWCAASCFYMPMRWTENNVHATKQNMLTMMRQWSNKRVKKEYGKQIEYKHLYMYKHILYARCRVLHSKRVENVYKNCVFGRTCACITTRKLWQSFLFSSNMKIGVLSRFFFL